MQVRSGVAAAFPGIGAAFTHTMAVKAVGFALGFANSVVVARALGPAGRGQFSLLLTAALFLGLLLGPLNAANTILLGREPQAVRALTVNSAVGALLAMLVCAALLLAVPPAPLARVLGDAAATAPLLLVLLTALVGLQVFVGAVNGLLFGRQEFYFTNYASLLQAGVTLGLNVALIVVLGWHVGGALLALCLAWAVVLGISLSRVSTYAEWAASPARFSTARFRTALGIGGRAIAANLPAVLMLRSDVFLIQYYLGTGPVGIYSVGVNIAELILIVGASLNTIAFAKAASEDGAAGGIARAARFSLYGGIAAWLGLALVAPWLFGFVYGAPFAPAALPAVLVMAGIVAWNFQTPLAGYIVGRANYPVSYIAIACCCFLLNLALNVVLIPRYGLEGAALATVAAYALLALLVTRAFARLTDSRPAGLVVLSRADLAVAGAGLGALAARVRRTR